MHNNFSQDKWYISLNFVRQKNKRDINMVLGMSFVWVNLKAEVNGIYHGSLDRYMKSEEL